MEIEVESKEENKLPLKVSEEKHEISPKDAYKS